jgi:hypothetical protein
VSSEHFTHEFTVKVIDGDESVRISIYTLLDCTSDSFLTVNLLSPDQTLALSRKVREGNQFETSHSLGCWRSCSNERLDVAIVLGSNCRATALVGVPSAVVWAPDLRILVKQGMGRPLRSGALEVPKLRTR